MKANKEGFGKFGLAEKNSQKGKAEGPHDKPYAKEENDNPEDHGLQKKIPSFNKSRNAELHYGSRTNY